ncbi:MFS transporter [Lactobacillus delbrueckii subsp. bulgaricus]
MAKGNGAAQGHDAQKPGYQPPRQRQVRQAKGGKEAGEQVDEVAEAGDKDDFVQETGQVKAPHKQLVDDGYQKAGQKHGQGNAGMENMGQVDPQGAVPILLEMVIPLTKAFKTRPGVKAMSVKKHRYAATASTVYFSYFMMGIGMSLLAQFKPQFASLWHSSISEVLSVVSAVGIGGIVSILITGPISDHFGRRASAVIGHLLWAIYYIGLLYAPNFAVAYIIGILGGIANSFLNASNFPALMEIFPESASVAGLMSKFAINIGQFCLPLAILLGTALDSGYRTVFMLAEILYIVMALILAFSPYPDQVTGPKKQEKAKHDFKPVANFYAAGFVAGTAAADNANNYAVDVITSASHAPAPKPEATSGAIHYHC